MALAQSTTTAGCSQAFGALTDNAMLIASEQTLVCEFFLFPFLLEVLLPGGVRAPGRAKTRIRAIKISHEFRCHSAMFRGKPFFRQNDELDRPRQRFFFALPPPMSGRQLSLYSLAQCVYSVPNAAFHGCLHPGGWISCVAFGRRCKPQVCTCADACRMSLTR